MYKKTYISVVLTLIFGSLGTLVAQVATTDRNYIHEVAPQKEVTIENIDNVGGTSDPAMERHLQNITYYDGLGRPIQQLGIMAAPDSKDIVTHFGYDQHGRQDKEWMPYYEDSGNLGGLRTGTSSATQQYYQAQYPDDFTGMQQADVNSYAQKEFEASPLNRVMKQAAPGKAWRLGGNHEVRLEYDMNSASEVRRFDVTLNLANNTYTPSLAENGHYGSGELYKSITKDENWTSGVDHTMESYTDKQGRQVLTRKYNSGVAHDTYYVYDEHGNLAYVVPPKVNTTDGVSAIELSELCYQYIYDHRNRLVEKKQPGKDWEHIVYNRLDQAVLVQDALLRPNKKWLFTKYDAFGRVVYTGIYTHGSAIGRSTMQTVLDNHYTGSTPPKFHEKKQSTAGSYHYYTNTSFPNSGLEVLTVNYYDGYVFDKDGGNDPGTVYSVSTSSNVKGLATGSKVKVLDTSDWITTVTYFDEKGRSIYGYSRNDYLDATDIVESKLDFTGKAREAKTSHTKGTAPTIITTDVFTYDHMGRLLKQEQTLGGNTEVIVQNVYDGIGQLVKKKAGNTVASPLQEIDFAYNVRGWLKQINDPNSLGSDLFAFKVNYNDPTNFGANEDPDPLYNGNISQVVWKTLSANPSGNPVSSRYSFGYDALNRITSANDNTGNYDVSNITYDKVGNIQSLTRDGFQNGSFPNMDVLDYDYDDNEVSNRLYKVNDSGNGNYGFKDSSVDDQDYWYDLNGNMTKDDNKGINSISYNHLNLPTSVAIAGGSISYVYDATGIKLKKTVSTGEVTEYTGNHVYNGTTSSSVRTLQFFNHPEGYVHKDGGAYKYVYQYKDHLGNIRLSYEDANNNGSVGQSEIIEENNYYPFGLKHKGYNEFVSSLGNSVAKKWKFGGKEWDESLGLETYDFGARNYMPDIGRWGNVDPLAELMPSHSTFNFGFNSPIYFMDTDGRSPKGFLNDPYLIFDASESKIHIWDDNDTPNDPTDDILIGSFDAHNSVISSSKGIWPDGIYDMLDRIKPHAHARSTDIELSIPAEVDEHGTRIYMSRDSKNGAYGANGIYRAKNFRDSETGRMRVGMGIHAGREYKNFNNRKTNGCIRCEPAFFPAVSDAIRDFGGLTKIIVVNNTRGKNPKVDIDPQPIVPIPVLPPTVDPPNIVPPVTPNPSPTPPPPPFVVPPRPPDSGF